MAFESYLISAIGALAAAIAFLYRELRVEQRHCKVTRSALIVLVKELQSQSCTKKFCPDRVLAELSTIPSTLDSTCESPFP